MAIVKKFNNVDKVIAEKNIIDHNQLANRDQYGAHSISSIRKLPEKLTALKEKDVELSQAIIDEETRAITRENAIEENAQRISLIDNNDSTLTFTNYDGETNNVKSGHLVDDVTIQEINDRSTLQVIGVTGTFDKTIDGQITDITETYSAEDIYDDIQSAGGINLVEEIENEEQTGKLLFTDYSGITRKVQGGFLPDNDTITLNDAKLALKKVYVDSDTIVGDGTSANDALNAKAIKDANGIITVSDINAMSSEIQSIQGRGGYLRPYDFGTANPNQPIDDLIASPPVYSALTQYALQEIGTISDPIEIFNGTRVTNLYNNHTWILNNTQDTNPTVFEWVDLGQSLVSVATDQTLAVVKSSAEELEGSVDLNGVITINGLEQALTDVQSAIDDVQVNSATKAEIENKIESNEVVFTISSADWQALTSNEPYMFSATIDCDYSVATTGEPIYELINNNPVNFANYGFALYSVDFNDGVTAYPTPKFTFYAIEKPQSNVTLKVLITAPSVTLTAN